MQETGRKQVPWESSSLIRDVYLASSGAVVVEMPTVTEKATLKAQGQWQAVMGSNPSYFKNCGSKCPVEQVSWNDVQELIMRLNQREGGGTGIACLQRRSGSMRPGPGARPDSVLAMTKAAWVSMLGITETRGAGPNRLEARSPMPGDFTTCTETYGSGVRTGRGITRGMR